MGGTALANLGRGGPACPLHVVQAAAVSCEQPLQRASLPAGKQRLHGQLHQHVRLPCICVDGTSAALEVPNARFCFALQDLKAVNRSVTPW